MELRGCLLLPGQDSWLEMEEVVGLHKTKGLMGMATKDSPDLRGECTHLPAQCPQPPTRALQ